MIVKFFTSVCIPDVTPPLVAKGVILKAVSCQGWLAFPDGWIAQHRGKAISFDGGVTRNSSELCESRVDVEQVDCVVGIATRFRDSGDAPHHLDTSRFVPESEPRILQTLQSKI